MASEIRKTLLNYSQARDGGCGDDGMLGGVVSFGGKRDEVKEKKVWNRAGGQKKKDIKDTVLRSKTFKGATCTSWLRRYIW